MTMDSLRSSIVIYLGWITVIAVISLIINCLIFGRLTLRRGQPSIPYYQFQTWLFLNKKLKFTNNNHMQNTRTTQLSYATMLFIKSETLGIWCIIEKFLCTQELTGEVVKSYEVATSQNAKRSARRLDLLINLFMLECYCFFTTTSQQLNSLLLFCYNKIQNLTEILCFCEMKPCLENKW